MLKGIKLSTQSDTTSMLDTPSRPTYGNIFALNADYLRNIQIFSKTNGQHLLFEEPVAGTQNECRYLPIDHNRATASWLNLPTSDDS